jgi:hypothetical protein
LGGHWAEILGLFVGVVIVVEPVHTPCVNEDQDDKDINGTLLSEPKTERHAEKLNRIQRFHEEDSESDGHKGPNSEEEINEPLIRFPIFF